MNNSLVTKRTTCRLCESDKLSLALHIKPSPIADAFVTSAQKQEKQPLIPLDLYQCQSCGHVQNIDIVNPELLFRDYIFRTGSSAGLVEHFKHYANDVVNKFEIKPNSLVVEIGSNDGTLLNYFKNKEMKVLGIDPALEITKEANASGIPTIPDFFSSKLASTISKEHGQAKLIVANNVYAHSDQLADMTDAIASLLDHDGVFVFEVSYLLDIVDNFVFDTVYHEHLSYHSIQSFANFFKLHGLHLFDVEKITTKGGSMRGFVQKLSGPRKEQPIIEQMIKEEMRRGLNTLAIFQQYEREILACKEAVTAFVDDALKAGKRVVGFGASTTVITLMYHFELQDKLEYLIDDNTRKHGMYSPGSHLEVKPSSFLLTDKPDIVIIMAWQYADVIIRKNNQYLANGGDFVVPLPKLRVVSHDMEKAV